MSQTRVSFPLIHELCVLPAYLTGWGWCVCGLAVYTMHAQCNCAFACAEPLCASRVVGCCVGIWVYDGAGRADENVHKGFLYSLPWAAVTATQFCSSVCYWHPAAHPPACAYDAPVCMGVATCRFRHTAVLRFHCRRVFAWLSIASGCICQKVCASVVCTACSKALSVANCQELRIERPRGLRLCNKLVSLNFWDPQMAKATMRA